MSKYSAPAETSLPSPGFTNKDTEVPKGESIAGGPVGFTFDFPAKGAELVMQSSADHFIKRAQKVWSDHLEAVSGVAGRNLELTTKATSSLVNYAVEWVDEAIIHGGIPKSRTARDARNKLTARFMKKYLEAAGAKEGGFSSAADINAVISKCFIGENNFSNRKGALKIARPIAARVADRLNHLFDSTGLFDAGFIEMLYNSLLQVDLEKIKLSNRDQAIVNVKQTLSENKTMAGLYVANIKANFVAIGCHIVHGLIAGGELLKAVLFDWPYEANRKASLTGPVHSPTAVRSMPIYSIY